ncbi:hypothetical protein RB195_001284 [Necator americanus]|uniref:Uncharacterized protein n=1 Tax=Necator americanus TaxID=51031 RepID=A0ABR1DDJ0_NECAM
MPTKGLSSRDFLLKIGKVGRRYVQGRHATAANRNWRSYQPVDLVTNGARITNLKDPFVRDFSNFVFGLCQKTDTHLE